ncbi:Thymocyte nuclear protein 1 [Leucoagaricus sp. SymC.cos]|nr:Thymocyte nuclear protein 1 [Leucoagaricus sp. SymC.cos]
MAAKYWLLKAEPDSRIVKGKDVKFSVEDFECVGTSPWEGVRNYEARNLMKEMQVGEKAVFYHSNCKSPGIAGFAEVAKEAYPDYTAWDASHPYYDSKSDKDNPKWYMVDLKFTARAKHFIPLALLRHIADSTANVPPEGIKYIGEDGVKAIKGMNLVTRGRLSVQRIEPSAWSIIHLLADNGGWEEMDLKSQKKARKPVAKAETSSKAVTKVTRKNIKASAAGAEKEESPLSSLASDSEAERPKDIAAEFPHGTGSRKRKAPMNDGLLPQRRSGRRKRAD